MTPIIADSIKGRHVAYKIPDQAVKVSPYGQGADPGASFLWMKLENLFMEKTLVTESTKLPTATEYRVRDGKIEARLLDGEPAHEADWTEVSSEQLSNHVLSNTAVARWLERNLGWRRLLRACVGEEKNENEMSRKRDDRMHVYRQARIDSDIAG